jgi:hypothetical protein
MDNKYNRYARLMFPLESLVERKLKGKSQTPRIYRTAAVLKRRAANKVAYKSKRTNYLVDHHKNKR